MFLITKLNAPVYNQFEENFIFTKPLNKPFKITNEFKIGHDGIDLISLKNKEVFSVFKCKITKIYETENKTPALECKNQIFTIKYLHITTSLKEGTSLEVGQKIGLYNNKGKANGSHLHLIIFENERLINPLNFLL